MVEDCGRTLIFSGLFFLLASLSVRGQESTSSLGCTFGDDKHIYHIDLLPEQHNLACPSADAFAALTSVTEAKTDELYKNARQLQALADRLTSRNKDLWDKILLLKKELKEMQEELATKQAVTECPPGYEVKNETFKSCYMFVAEHLDWYMSEAYCISTGGHLVALETQEEQAFMAQYISSHNYLREKHLWTGGNDFAAEGEWMWAGINIPFNYTQWLSYPHKEQGPIQMPDNDMGIEHCVHLFYQHNYDWNDLFCYNRHFFICEYKLV